METIIRLTSLALLLATLTHCAEPAPESTTTSTEPTADLSAYPAEFVDVLNEHGGLDAWRSHHQLSYAMPKAEGPAETQLVDLYGRRERIEQPGNDVIMGHDGERSWVVADTSYRGNPAFYKNLYFYFYAMPWVLADEGIIYDEAEPLTYDGVTYPGILVSYNDGVGYSPKDNYRLHYDPATKRMRWLGYTVTGRSGKSSDKFSWIEYPTYSDQGGVELPDSLVWYTVENNQPIEPRRAQVFTDVQLATGAAEDAQFAMPDNGRIAE